jgi:cytochrome P450
MAANRLLGFGEARGDEVIMDMWRLLDAGPGAVAASGRLLEAAADLVTAKMSRPGEDLPSHLLAAHPGFTVDELSREVLMLIVLIGDFTSTLICNTAAEVITGDARARAGLTSGLIRETVERAAMLSPPMANLTFRFATRDTRLGETVVAAGDPVMLSVAAAHTDPAFSGGGRPDLIRGSRAHLAWGAGPHQCLGSDLATTIVTIAVERLFERCGRLALVLPPDQLPWRSSPLMRGLRSLPVQFELRELAPRPQPDLPTTPQPDHAHDSQGRSLSNFLKAVLRGR